MTTKTRKFKFTDYNLFITTGKSEANHLFKFSLEIGRLDEVFSLEMSLFRRCFEVALLQSWDEFFENSDETFEEDDTFHGLED